MLSCCFYGIRVKYGWTRSMSFKRVWKEMLAKLPKPERSTSWVQLTDQTQQGSSNRFYYKYYFTLSFSASSIKFFRFSIKPFPHPWTLLVDVTSIRRKKICIIRNRLPRVKYGRIIRWFRTALRSLKCHLFTWTEHPKIRTESEQTVSLYWKVPTQTAEYQQRKTLVTCSRGMEHWFQVHFTRK